MRKLFLGLLFILLLLFLILFFFQSSTITKENAQKNENLSWPRIPATETQTNQGSGNPPTHHYHAYSTEPSHGASPGTYYEVSSETSSAPTAPPSKALESVVKYVLFSIAYYPQMSAGETRSLQLTMSPRSERAKLEKVVSERKIKPGQINDIEKVRSQYKYVSAELIAQNNCLQVQKMMPREDKVYLPNVNESSSDQLWQWDLTAPEEPSTNICHLSLFIRFCMNQTDCLPMEDPDKEFNINIEITFGHKIYKWLTNFGHLAAIIIPILTIIGIISGWLMRKKGQKKGQA